MTIPDETLPSESKVGAAIWEKSGAIAGTANRKHQAVEGLGFPMMATPLGMLF